MREKFNKLLEKKGIIIAPGCYDALSAKIIENAGFECAYMTGYGSSAGLLGKPDVGLLSMEEMISNATRIVNAIDIPLIADADTGYGNPLNIIRTVKEYEKCGVSAIHIEDQVTPKRCGHMEGKEVISAEEMAQKIKAAVDARENTDFKIIARTDARAVLGLDEAIRRAKLYREAGADIIFVESPYTVDEFKIISHEINAPLLANMAEGAKSPMLSAKELEDLGYKIVIYPVGLLFAAAKAMLSVAKEIRDKGTDRDMLNNMTSFKEFNDFIGLSEYNGMSNKYKTEA
ncbi:MAG: oxaloacetate decarboxylase [Thermoanaerobacteraceae bacterium]|nr:oxaloacetate decarboxylase [Thermoanaerobacteraceae bacterium]